MARSPLIRDLRVRLGAESVLSAPSELAVYDCDAFTIERQAPDAVVLPRSSRQVAEVVKVAHKHDVPLVPRGAGTSLAGGCVPVGGGIVVLLTRMNQILEINLRDRTAVVEAGVPNIELTRRLAGTGYHYAPDPSSQGASTIGGNVATNAGGPHTLKYGVTVNHVLGIEAVLSDGSIVRLGPVENPGELDLIGLLVGGEGTLGIVTKVWVRLTPDPQDYRTMRAIFDTVEDATRAVSRIIAAGIIPAAMELMDQAIMTALEEAFHFGFPSDAGAILVIELDGPAVGLDAQQERVVEFCQNSGAREVLHAASPEERALLWKCRKSAAGALGRLSPNYFTQDGVVPRTRLPEIIRRIGEIGRKYQIEVVNVAHAGDGNVHPVLLIDERDPEQVQRALAAGRELLGECIECGGSITAEHGIGVEKIALMDRLFTADDLAAMARVRQSFDPTERFNPGKVLPNVVVRSANQRFVRGSLREPAFGRGSLREPAFVRGANNDYTTVAPADAAEVAGAVRSAYGDKTPIYAIGGGTALDYGGRPSRPGLGLSLEKLSRVVDYPADDMTITVEAGLTIAELASRLQENHQRLPIDVPNADRATIGGAIAANAGGPRRYAHGTMRDYLIGFRAVDGRGTEFGGGGRVVKNAAGYDMCKLMIGSLGTLAVITQVTLMVRPVPETFALIAGDVEDFDTAERLLAAVVHTKTLPVAVELLAGPTQPAGPMLGPAAESSVARLVVGFEGSQSEVDWMVGRLRDEWSKQGVSTPVVISSAASSTTAQTAWKWLSELPADVQINVRPGAAVAMIEHVLRLDPQCSIQAHAGNGVVRAAWSPAALSASVSETPAAALCNELRPAAADSGGVATMLSVPDGVELSTRDIWGPPRDAAVVMRAIKDRFDPRGILNPGRLDYGHFKTERPDHPIR